MVMSMHGHGLRIFRPAISNLSGARSVARAGQCEHERANLRLVSQRGDHGNAAESDHDPCNLGFHEGIYQPLTTVSAYTLDPPCGPRVSRETRKPTRLISRSVALLARLHPKCPFQVKLLRVRAFLTLLPSTGVLRSSRTIWMPDQTGQYGTFPIPTKIRAAEAPVRAALASPSRSGRTARPPPRAPRWLGTT